MEVFLKREKRGNTLAEGQLIYNNMKKTLIVLLFSIFIAGSNAGAVLAEEAATTSQDNQTTAQEETVTPEDLGVGEPTILPDSPLYFLKSWARSIQLVLTFDPIKKAELQLKFSNEKIIETEKMVTLKKTQEKVQSALKNYQETILDVATATKKIKEKVEESQEVEKFMEKFTNQSALQQKILEKLETQVPTATAEKIIEMRQTHLEKFGEVMQKLENREEQQIKILENFENKLENTTTINIDTQQIQNFQQKMESIKSNISNKVMTGLNVTPSNTSQTAGCDSLWWFDSSTKICQQKQFCGMYMYFGLQTFDSKEECEKGLLEVE